MGKVNKFLESYAIYQPREGIDNSLSNINAFVHVLRWQPHNSKSHGSTSVRIDNRTFTTLLCWFVERQERKLLWTFHVLLRLWFLSKASVLVCWRPRREVGGIEGKEYFGFGSNLNCRACQGIPRPQEAYDQSRSRFCSPWLPHKASQNTCAIDVRRIIKFAFGRLSYDRMTRAGAK